LVARITYQQSTVASADGLDHAMAALITSSVIARMRGVIIGWVNVGRPSAGKAAGSDRE
jgi:hypothetical protein